MQITATAERPASATDAQLIDRARRGDAAAFDLLVAGRLNRCYRLAWSILLNDADAADATQDGFLAAWRDLPRLRDTAAFDGWLNRIVANKARMFRRHKARLREVQVRPIGESESGGATPPERPAPSTEPSPFDRVDDADAIGRAFDALRERDRVVLALYYVDERPVAEIARVLDVPVGTVKSRLHFARLALEQALEARS